MHVELWLCFSKPEAPRCMVIGVNVGTEPCF